MIEQKSVFQRLKSMKTILTKIWFALLISLLIIPACRQDDQSQSQAAVDMVIIYQREGGFGGLTDQWTIHPDGSIVAPREQELKGDEEGTAAVFSLASSAETEKLAASYVPDDNCCDKFIYTITIQTGDQEQTIETSDDVQQPQHLTDLLTAIDGLIADAAEIQ